MNHCYLELNLKIFPFRKSVETLVSTDWPPNRMDKLYPVDELNPELLEFFSSADVKIRETFLLINWWTHRSRPAHTDGNWFSDEKYIIKRQCGINWNFTSRSWVEFYSMENATPVFDPKGRIDDATIWPYAYKVVDKWNSPGPVIFNPQIPHRVNSASDVERRVSCTLRFFETFDSLKDKLSLYLI